MSARVTVFQATMADAQAIAPLFDGYRQFYGKASDLPRAHWFISERLSRGESVILVASLPQVQGLVGFTQLYPIFTSVNTGRIWHLNDLFVLPSSRRLGVAKALMQQTIAFARQDGAVRLTLETAVDNAPARALYENLGMTLGTTFVKYAIAMD
jgi:ribosomal protein S18 acetylase RimI-like enzyme